jgi:acyl-CoA synthetase (AMP-forming)/AMP-acid ligase II
VLPNTTQVLELHYSVSGPACAVVLNLNQRLAPTKLGYMLTDASPTWLIVAKEFQELFEESVKYRYLE